MLLESHGIEVYYSNQKGTANTVFFDGIAPREYGAGEMLMELLSEEGAYVFSEKASILVRQYWKKDEPVTEQNIFDSQNWVRVGIDEEDVPVAGEIAKSCLMDIIADFAQNRDEIASCTNMGEFLDLCIESYSKLVAAYYALFEAAVHNASGKADEDQTELADRLNSVVEGHITIYGRARSSKPRYDGSMDTVRIQDPITLLIFEFCRMKKMHKAIKICHNCGRYFIPEKRAAVTIFCPDPSPQDPRRTCRKIGPQLKKSKAIKESDFEANHRTRMNHLTEQIRNAKKDYDPQDKDARDYLMDLIDQHDAEKMDYREAKKEKNEQKTKK